MLVQRQNIFFLVIFLVITTACSTSKNKFINREYHTLNTRYNVLFNGKEAFAIGLDILESVHEDNFFELLPVEPITLNGENFDETTVVPGFDRAEDKAVKAIQKHSMNIKTVQYNRQIDDAYLLLGKARYYDRRFFPALEAFNFLLENNAAYGTYTQGRIWKEKTNIRLNNNDLAIKNLRPLLGTLKTKDPNYSLSHATIGEAFINKRQLDSASFFLSRAARDEKNKQKKGRYLFISGQLHEALGEKEAALEAYNQIIRLKRKVPRKFTINAKMKRFLLAGEKDSIADQIAFRRMLNNYENKSYRHSIYRTMATYFKGKQNDSLTQHYLKQSLQSPSIDVFTQIYNYNDLIDLSFNKGNYLRAGLYLDSLIPLYGEQSLQRKRTQRKRDNLAGVIYNETIVKETDSLLYLMRLSKEEQRLFFKEAIDKKRETERLAIAKKAPKKRLFTIGKEENRFYFYNPSLVVKGKQQYRSTWGNRPNVDNWRNASLLRMLENQPSTENKKAALVKEIIVESPESFMVQLAKRAANIDSIRNNNHRAYLQLGMIYKEKYKNNELAIDRLTHLLRQNPLEKYAAPARYHLYKIYEKTDIVLANQYKETLLRENPKTPFALVLRNLNTSALDEIQTPETQYAQLLEKFNAQQFEAVIQESKALEAINSGSDFEPKLKLLKANAIGRLEGVSAWIKALQEVVEDFEKTPEGDYAKSLLSQINASEGLAENGKNYSNYKWVFPFSKKDSLKSAVFYTRFSKEIKEYMPRWEVTLDSYDIEFNFVVVHGIRQRNRIDAWIKNELKEKENFKNTNYFVVLTREYRNIIKNKTWEVTAISNEELR